MRYNLEIRKDKVSKNGLAPIRLVVKHEKIRIRKNLEVRSAIENWDTENELIVFDRKHPYQKEYKEWNRSLVEIKDKVESIFKFFEYNEVEFNEKQFLDRFENDDKNVAVDFFDAFDEYIKVSKLTKAESSVKKFITTRNKLMQFKSFTKYPLRFDTINVRFEEEFMDYCFNEKEYLNNYYSRLIAVLKTFMTWSKKRGYHSNGDYHDLKRLENETEVIRLTYKELMQLYNYDFKNKALERSRDMFCFGAFTSLRHSDVFLVSDARFEENFLNMTIVKTKTMNHLVPLTDVLKELVLKYKGTIYEPIPKITSQKLNENLKKCAEILGWDERVVLTRYRGARPIRKEFRRYELITSHVARKTFISVSLELGIPERVVKNISNHKDERSFRRYVKLEGSYLSKEMTKWNKGA